MQIITVSAGGHIVRERLQPFFQAYKYYKLGSVKMSFVPASTLPVDPSGLSIDPDEAGVDPRDQLNPGLTRITNGEDFLDDITGWTSSQQELVYNNMLLDRRWYKFQLQAGLKRSAVPLYWQIGQLHQDYYPGATLNLPNYNVNGSVYSEETCCFNSVVKISDDVPNTGVAGFFEHDHSDPRGIFQTGHKGRLSWLPTDAYIHHANLSRTGVDDVPAETAIPTVECFKIILPKAYKTLYWYRVYVTETVYFRDPVTYGGDGICYGSLDRFIRPGRAQVLKPGEASLIGMSPPNPPNGGE